MFPGYGVNVGPELRRGTPSMSIMGMSKDKAPPLFPLAVWEYHAQRYYDYWRWFNGEIFAERRSTENAEILKYPLSINPIRNFARKHASMVIGEEAMDSPQPLIKPVVTPLPVLDGSDMTGEQEKRLALVAENIVQEVWSQSNGRSLQMENATLQQFLGGSVWKVSWQPWRSKEFRIPIFVENVIPDFFLPVHEANNFYNLLEAYVVYRIPAHVAKEQYGAKGVSDGWVIYVEHWTRHNYSVYIDGQPLTSSYTGVLQTYSKLKNPFGFVPFVYVPHLREGNFYGASIVDDMRGLAKEYNSRMADLGDAIRDSVHRERYASNITGNAKPLNLDRDKGITAINLGVSNPAIKAEPKVWTEDPPMLSDGLTNMPAQVWTQLMREGSVSDVSFGEDEGSQRSGMTLLLRMWPTISHARAERIFMAEGLNQVAKYILAIATIKRKEIKVPIIVPDDFYHRIQISQDWLPMVPRDRETVVNEVVLRVQAGLMSPEHALEVLGDVPYIQEELKRIKDWMEFQSKLQQSATEIAGAGQGAQSETPQPKAQVGEEDN